MRSLPSRPVRFLAGLWLALVVVFPAFSQRQVENLGRGVVAQRTTATEAYLSWRLLGTDPDDIAFNVYRAIGGGAPVQVNGAPVTATTDFRDSSLAEADFTSTIAYHVRPILGGVEQAASAAFTLAANAPIGGQFLTIPLSTPTPNPASTNLYEVKFGWVGDLDGDGEYDFVVDRVSKVEGERQYLEAYKRDGTFLWRMDMGPNSLNQYAYEPGSSAISVGDTDNVTVYDMDGDGLAEVIVRTSNGVTVSNAGGTPVAAITDANDANQFVSVFNGLTGVELARTPLPNPWSVYGTLTSKCAIAFFDGSRPSVLFYGYNRDGSGPFYRAFSAFDYRNGVLSLRWTLAQDQAVLPGAEGHQIRIADVDNDGRDEVCDLGHVIDDDGTQLFHTELTHGDRFHIADLNPDWPGLETYAIQQYNPTQLATAYFSADTGAMFKKWYAPTPVDVGRGIALDLTAAHYGYEMYSTQPGIWNANGDRAYTNNLWAPEGLWWDGDLAREFIDGAGSGALNPAINKFNPATGVADRIYTMYSDYTGSFVIRQAYGGRPAFWGDILGDWREEVVVFTSDCTAIRIYNTNLSATNRLYTLMHNPAYRMQATTKGYVQASYVDYYLGYGMFAPPPPPLSTASRFWVGGAGAANTWDAGTTASWRAGFHGSAAVNFSNGEHVLFDHTGANAAPVLLNGTLTPGGVTVYSTNHYTFDGTAGSLGGGAALLKQGAGSLTITGAHGFTGATTVWDGALRVDGTLSGSPVTVWGGIHGGALAGGETGGRLAGSGHVAQVVAVKYRGAITPGAGMNAAGTLFLEGGLATEAGSVLAFDLSDDPTGGAKPSDRLTITGDVTVGGATTLFIRQLDASLPPGTYTLATYTGSLTGGANLRVAGLEGTPYTLSSSGGAITVTVPTVRAADSIVWSGGAQWDLARTVAWTLGGSPTLFVPGDAVTFDATGASSPAVTIAEAVNPSSMTVDSASDYTFTGTGMIIGAGGLTKSGAGTLTVTGNHAFTGPVVIQGGSVVVAELNDGGVASSLGAAPAAAGNLTLGNHAALRVTGSESTSTNREITLGAGGGTLEVSTSGVTLQLGGNIGGSGALTKAGSGGIILASPNSYTGGTTIEGGLVALASDAANVSGLGTGGVTLVGGTLQMFYNDLTPSAATSTWPIHVPAGGAGTLRLDGRCNLTGALTGAGDFTIYTPYVRSELNGDWSAFTGRVFAIADADGGDLRLRHAAGLPLAELSVGDRVYANYLTALAADTTIPLGALSGVAGGTLAGGPTAGRTLTWSVGGKNVDTTFAAALVNGTGPTALAKVGTGTLTLAGANTYTGATTVSAGVLLVNGTSSASAFTVQAGAVLGGSGTITGAVSLQNGSRLLAGAAALNVAGTVTGAGTVGVTATGLRSDGTYHVLSAAALAGSPAWSYVGPLGASQGASFTIIGGNVYVTLSSPSTPRSAAAISWTGASSGFWDPVAANWKLDADGTPTIFTAGDSLTFDDSHAANPAVTLVFAASPASVTFNNATTAYTLAAGAGGISGSTTLVKNGAGSLVLSGGNSYSGATTVNAGTLLVNGTSAASAFTVNSGAVLGGTGSITGPVTFATGAKLRALTTGPLTVGGTVSVSGALSVTSPTTLTDGYYTLVSATTISGSATWSYDGPLSLNQVPTITVSGTTITLEHISHSPQPIVWTAAGGNAWTASSVNWKLLADGTPTSFIAGDSPIFNDTLSGAQAVTLGIAVQPATVTFANSVATYTLTATSPGITGAANVVKTGTANATMAGTNTYTGGTTISGGTLTITSITALGSGVITLNGGTWATGALTPANAVNVIADSSISGGNAGGTHGVKDISGTSTSTLTLNATTGVFDLEGSLAGFAGRVFFSGGGGFRLFGSSGSSAADFDLGTRNVSARSGAAIALGSITGTGTAVLGVATNSTTYSIGGNNKSTTFPGVITNPAATYRASVTKVGTGTLTLSGANTYTGTTVVDAGTLVVAGAQNHGNNTNGTGAVTVNGGTLEITGSLTNVTTVEVKSGATLKLTGTLTTGTLTVRAGGKLIGGGTVNGTVVNEGLIEAVGAATFTINGALTNAATGTIRLKKGGALVHGGGLFTNQGVYDVITAGAHPNPGAGGGSVLEPGAVIVSSFALTSGGAAELSVATHAGHSYQLQRKAELTTATWDNIGTSVEGTGGTLTLSDATPPAGSRGFYRVIVDQ